MTIYEDFKNQLWAFSKKRKEMENHLKGVELDPNKSVEELVSILKGKVNEEVLNYLGVSNNERTSPLIAMYIPDFRTLARIVERYKEEGQIDTGKIAEEVSRIVEQTAEGLTLESLTRYNSQKEGREIIKGLLEDLEPLNPTDKHPDDLAAKVNTPEDVRRYAGEAYRTIKGARDAVERLYSGL